MRELICLHVGQCGVQIGSALWELLCLEQNIDETGHILDNANFCENYDVYFTQVYNKYIPRACLIDLEPTVVDEVRTGAYKSLFHPSKIINGPEDAASNFARGFFTVGKLIMGRIDNQIRNIMESCNSVQAIMLFRSLSGGTGSGLTSAMFEVLAEYPKTVKIEFPIYPCTKLNTGGNSTVEPYNCLLGEHFCMEDVGLGVVMDNESLFKIATETFINKFVQPNYASINRIISQLVSSMTSSLRSENVTTSDVSVLQANLIPYPRIRYPLASMAPILSPMLKQFESPNCSEMTKMLFRRENQFIDIDPISSTYMSCVLQFRGPVSVSDIYEALYNIKNSKFITFVDWCPTGFKVGVNLSETINNPSSAYQLPKVNVSMLANNSAMGLPWQRISQKFYTLYSKRAFVHWFVSEGMEECEFTESLYNISSLVRDYDEISQPTCPENTHKEPKERMSGYSMKEMEKMSLNQMGGSSEDEDDDGEDGKISYYVAMAKGTTVTALDRESLQQKTSNIIAGYKLDKLHADLQDHADYTMMKIEEDTKQSSNSPSHSTFEEESILPNNTPKDKGEDDKEEERIKENKKQSIDSDKLKRQISDLEKRMSEQVGSIKMSEETKSSELSDQDKYNDKAEKVDDDDNANVEAKEQLNKESVVEEDEEEESENKEGGEVETGSEKNEEEIEIKDDKEEVGAKEEEDGEEKEEEELVESKESEEEDEVKEGEESEVNEEEEEVEIKEEEEEVELKEEDEEDEEDNNELKTLEATSEEKNAGESKDDEAENNCVSSEEEGKENHEEQMEIEEAEITVTRSTDTEELNLKFENVKKNEDYDDEDLDDEDDDD